MKRWKHQRINGASIGATSSGASMIAPKQLPHRSHWLSTALFRRSVSVTDIDNLCHLVESLQSRCSELERANRELTNALREPPEERAEK